MKYETTLVRHLFPLIVLSSAVTITAFAQSDISGPAPAIVAGDLDAELAGKPREYLAGIGAGQATARR
jgi:hypothetical protein